MKIVLTGGHFSPAHAVILKLKDTDDLLVIGRKYAFEGDNNETYEYKVCVEENIPFESINAGRLQRRISRYSIPSALRFPIGVIESINILRKFKPDVVVTFGGYVGLPVSIASAALKIPIVLHEQTLKAGLASRLIAKFASVILISYISSQECFKKRNVVLTGLPMRQEILQKKEIKFEKPMIYVTGGSTGSHVINEAITQILPSLLSKFIVIHQTGNSKEYDDFAKAMQFRNTLSRSLIENYKVQKFFNANDVSTYFQNAVLVIGRSGINTVTELILHGTVAILIPLPIGQMNEQKSNAIFFKKLGLGEYIEQKDLSPKSLLDMIHAMIKGLNTYKNNAQNAQKLIDHDAVKKVIDQIYIYGKRSDNRRQSKTPF